LQSGNFVFLAVEKNIGSWNKRQMQQQFIPRMRTVCKQVYFILFLITVALVFNCLAQENDDEHQDRIEYHLDRLKKDTSLLTFSVIPASTLSTSTRAYLQFYGLDFENTRYYFGKFKSNGRNLAAHVFYPRKPIATVFLLHGYCDHTGNLKHLIRLLLDMKLAVAAFDLPGHGLSDGRTGSIDDFAEYATALADFVKSCRGHLPATSFFIGHSTGCAAELELMYRYPELKFSKVVFLAPLVHSAYWTITKANYYLAKPFVETVPRIFRDNSSDPEFIEFIRTDPLQCRAIPLKWVSALIAWNVRVQDYQPRLRSILIVQGTGDGVVDWKFNIPFLKRKFDAVKVNWIADARHQLANEAPAYRSTVFRHVRAYLSKN